MCVKEREKDWKMAQKIFKFDFKTTLIFAYRHLWSHLMDQSARQTFSRGTGGSGGLQEWEKRENKNTYGS